MTYDEAWFVERAWKALKKSAKGYWDFYDSVLLYLPFFVQEYVDLQEKETPYAKLVTRPESMYLQTIAERLCADLPDNFDYIDLGPGTEHKEQYFFDACKKLGRTFRYIPVDISERYLELASEYAKAQGYETHPVLAPFDACAALLPQTSVPRFVSLGLTYGNYDPEYMIPLLRTIAGEKGSAFIETQLPERVDMQAVQELYNPNIGMHGLSHQLRLIGLEPERDAIALPVNDGIRLWYEVVNVTPKLAELGMKSGDRILVFQSLRYSKDRFETMLKSAEVSYSLYDADKTFLAALVRF